MLRLTDRTPEQMGDAARFEIFAEPRGGWKVWAFWAGNDTDSYDGVGWGATIELAVAVAIADMHEQEEGDE